MPRVTIAFAAAFCAPPYLDLRFAMPLRYARATSLLRAIFTLCRFRAMLIFICRSISPITFFTFVFFAYADERQSRCR